MREMTLLVSFVSMSGQARWRFPGDERVAPLQPTDPIYRVRWAKGSLSFAKRSSVQNWPVESSIGSLAMANS
ncbi:MAG TPA: hypothetical protein VGL94_15910 [Ktedonobacteraceae bacterium]|jgi:hypothetical protein